MDRTNCPPGARALSFPSLPHRCQNAYSFIQAYALYLRLTRSAAFAQQQALKSEILATKSELLKTSAQDQFAKWAKLRRSVDKGLADLEKLSEYPLFFHHPSFPYLRYHDLLTFFANNFSLADAHTSRRLPNRLLEIVFLPEI